MTEFENSFINKTFLRAVWSNDYAAFKDSPAESAQLDRLTRWSARGDLGETSSESAFIEEFFRATWTYLQDGQQPPGDGYTLHPKLALPGAGADGGTGEADLAIGHFRAGSRSPPQALCEFKGIRTDLDAAQNRRGKHGSRSPVRQCLDYLSAARRTMFDNDPVLPLWAIVTDMNRFRLYWHDRGPSQFADFIIRPLDILDGPGLLANTEAARFDRFLFYRLFHRETLIATTGRPVLYDLIRDQGARDRAIETDFYREYRALRESLYVELLARNGPGTPRFPGTHGRLVRLAQKLLDRLLFTFFCEDMGQAMAFPPHLIRNILRHTSNQPYFDPDDQSIWPLFRRLFAAMNDGTKFGAMPIRQFNGGLFATDPALNALEIPDGIFCQLSQGRNEETIADHPLTILYLCARYSFAADLGDTAEVGNTKAVGLYMLGRIFEQSITELEILEAEADGQVSINQTSQRKRDGVYYTPEWVVTRIVELTLAPRLAELRAAAGFDETTPDRAALRAYRDSLRTLTILDPACGSGAFLITALRLLLREWRTLDLIGARLGGDKRNRGDLADRAREILSRNIFGIDINPASVEITQLALWLYTAKADRPLSNLDAAIRCGNSLVGPDFYREMQHALYDDEQRERVNAFDWREAFPTIAVRGGFDIVIGNPPYVKLQNFRAALPDVASYLRTGREVEGGQHYASTQTGNFDLYLPFIEKGIDMLNPQGRLGYIAPSLWAVNEYGAGLRTIIARHRNLDRWIDFKSFQVFEEATTYTALQFYTRAATPGVRVFAAPDGVIPAAPFATIAPLAWDRVPFGERWLLLDGAERALIDRLTTTCRRLDHPANTAEIFVGLQTSADAIYHLEKLAPGRYCCRPPGPTGQRPPSYEVRIEDGIMKPLVSGAEAKRYITPNTNTYLLFPYEQRDGAMRLIPPDQMAARFPLAWDHLSSYRRLLERREARRDQQGDIIGPVFDECWYRFGRNQSLDKQDQPKLIVAGTVPGMRVCFDDQGEFSLNNVRVNGIIAADQCDPWFLLGILNSRIVDFVFRRIAKPKDGNWFEANKQFIAPLPIPNATPAARTAIATTAQSLQTLHTNRRDLLARIATRLAAAPRLLRPDHWLFPALAQGKADLATLLAPINDRLHPAARLTADLHHGELRFLIDDLPVITHIFVTPAEADFLLAQWRYIAATFNPASSRGAKSLCKTLRDLATPENPPLTAQVIATMADLSACETEIATHEQAQETEIATLYCLTTQEQHLIAIA